MGKRFQNILQGPVLVFGAGLFFIFFAVYKGISGFQFLNWDETVGIVTKSRAEKHYIRERAEFSYYFA